MTGNPFDYFDAIHCINLDSATGRWQRMARRFAALRIRERVCRFEAVATPRSHHIGCALSHRAIIEEADQRGLDNVLVFEDDAIFLECTIDVLDKSIAELALQDWHLFYLGGHRWDGQLAEAPGCGHLFRAPWGLTCTHAVAYHRSIYRRILDDVPTDIDGVAAWISRHRAIDQYLRAIDRQFMPRPSVASQLELLAHEDPDLRDHYTLGDVFGLAEGWRIGRSGGRVTLSNPRTGHVVGLNATAAIVLDLVDGRRSVDGIGRDLQTAYPEAAGIVRDLHRTLGDLVLLGALTRC